MAIIEHLDVVYGTDDANQKMDVRTPSGTGPFPGLMCLPGGGFTGTGRKDPNFIELMEALTDEGFVTAAADYRIIPDFVMPSQLHDARGAIRAFRAGFATYNLDPDLVGIFGDSAGSILSGMAHCLPFTSQYNGTVGGNPGQSNVTQAACLVSGVASALRFGSLKPNDVLRVAILLGCSSPYGPDADAAIAAYLPNARDGEDFLYLSGATPPILIVQGALDDRLIIAGAKDLYYDAVEAGLNPATGQIGMFVNPDENHGLGNATTEDAFAAIVAFFTAKLV